MHPAFCLSTLFQKTQPLRGRWLSFVIVMKKKSSISFPVISKLKWYEDLLVESYTI